MYSILSSKPHNVHYLNRYIKFIKSCAGSGTIKHHICPKAKDLFPEFASFKTNPNNLALLTTRQHFIAHWMLWKVYGKSQAFAFHSMSVNIKNSRIFESLKIENSKYRSLKQKEISKNQLDTGTHFSQNAEFSTKISERNRSRVNDMTHNFMSTEFAIFQSKRQIELIQTNSHPFQDQNFIDNMKLKTRSRIKSQTTRNNVNILRIKLKETKMKLGYNWSQKSDEFINQQLKNLFNTEYSLQGLHLNPHILS